MSSFYRPSPAVAAMPAHAAQGHTGWPPETDDVALGCECANPALQIDCWRQEPAESLQSGGSSS